MGWRTPPSHHGSEDVDGDVSRAPCFPPGGDEAVATTSGGGAGWAGVARDPGGLGNQLVKFNYRVRGGGSCLETCERGWSKGVVVVDGMEGIEGGRERLTQKGGFE